jgi:hypothetical protein
MNNLHTEYRNYSSIQTKGRVFTQPLDEATLAVFRPITAFSMRLFQRNAAWAASMRNWAEPALRSCALCIVDSKGKVYLERELSCEIEDISDCLETFDVLVEKR